MKAIIALCHHRALQKLQLPVLLISALLQRTPVVRLVEAAKELVSSPTINLNSNSLGFMARSFAATAASLGALHSLAGATTLVASQNSVSAKVGTEITAVGFTVTDTINIASWRIGGTLPPGLTIEASQGGASLSGPGLLDATTPGSGDDGYGGTIGGNNTTTPVLRGTPTTPGNYTITLQAFEFAGASGLASNTFNYAINVAAVAATTVAPAFTKQPAAQSVSVGATVTLSATATGTPTPTYQWKKNGADIPNATSDTLTLTNVTTADAGTYSVVATNSAGTLPSAAITVTVTPTTPTTSAPLIARQPTAQTVATGSTVVFNVDATGSPAPAFQWRRNSTPITGATGAVLVIKGASAADAGTYSVVVNNSAGNVTSSAATLALSDDRYFGHLLNLSILTELSTAAPDFTVGTVIGGGGTSGNKALLARAVGPSLSVFGLGSAVTDSKIDLLSGSTVVGTNDNWGGAAAISDAGKSVGAFDFTSATSKDAAIYNPSTASGSYTLQIAGVSGAIGSVLAELYDATASTTFTAATPRLINVSVRKQLAAAEILTAGFVVGGNTSRTVLIRAIGPTLGAFGVPGTMSDPKLTLYAGSTVLAANDNWGGDAQLNAVCAAVGAFGISDTASKDAMLVITLPPGNYTAQVTGANNTSGAALVEIYEVP